MVVDASEKLLSQDILTKLGVKIDFRIMVKLCGVIYLKHYVDDSEINVNLKRQYPYIHKHQEVRDRSQLYTASHLFPFIISFLFNSFSTTFIKTVREKYIEILTVREKGLKS